MNQNPTKHTKVLIIGSVRGYTAAVYGKNAKPNFSLWLSARRTINYHY